MVSATDIALIDSVRSGNTADFGLLMDRYKDRAFSLLCRMLKNPLDAEEALQDAFIRAYRALPGFRLEAAFSTWLYRIVYTTALNRLASKQYRQQSVTNSIPDDDDISLAIPGDEGALGRSELLNQLIQQMPAAYAAVINLYYLEEMSVDEVAGITGQSAANIKVLLFRARKALKQLIIENNLTGDLL